MDPYQHDIDPQHCQPKQILSCFPIPPPIPLNTENTRIRSISNTWIKMKLDPQHCQPKQSLLLVPYSSNYFLEHTKRQREIHFKQLDPNENELDPKHCQPKQSLLLVPYSSNYSLEHTEHQREREWELIKPAPNLIYLTYDKTE